MALLPNPVLPGFNPDPSVCRVGSDFFLVTSTFEYFPGIPVYHSINLLDWTLIGHVLTRLPQLCLRATRPGHGIFAPTLRHHRGRFYVATTCVYEHNFEGPGPRGFYVWTDDIWEHDSWSDPVYLDVRGIDQDLFFDENGGAFLSWARPANVYRAGHPYLSVYCVEVDLETGRNVGEPVLIRQSTQKDGIAEGPHIFSRNGYYYLTTAEGGTDSNHQQWIFRSQSVFGPYESFERNPILFNDAHPAVQQTGHADFISHEDGQWYVLLLGIRRQATGLAHLGRETFIAQVEWVDDWPVINGGLPIDANERPVTPWNAQFGRGSNELELGWYHLRTPYRSEYSLSIRPNTLTIFGNAFCLDQQDSCAILLRKQIALSGKWKVTLDFAPEVEHEEAGTVVWWSRYSYMAFLVRREGTTRRVLLRWPDERNVIQEVGHDLTTLDPVDLYVQAEPTCYTFRFRTSERDWHKVSSLSTEILVRKHPDESPFIGTHLGLFAQGTNGVGCRAPAHFSDLNFCT